MNPKDKNTEFAREGTVVCLFRNQPQAELAIRGLKQEGFTDGQIGVLMQDKGKQEKLADSTGSTVSEAAKTGAIGGGIAGGVLGLLAGVGALAIPGIGPIIAGGALASTLAGAGIGAAAGGLLGALVGLGVPEEDARYFEEGVRAGGILVTVQAGSRTPEARQILTEVGGELDSTARTPSTSTFGTREGQQSESWRGNERRYRHDKSYAGPERRLTNV
jgi:hypothetical protein